MDCLIPKRSELISRIRQGYLDFLSFRNSISYHTQICAAFSGPHQPVQTQSVSSISWAFLLIPCPWPSGPYCTRSVLFSKVFMCWKKCCSYLEGTWKGRYIVGQWAGDGPFLDHDLHEIINKVKNEKTNKQTDGRMEVRVRAYHNCKVQHE